jgi:hypothetical protein
MNTTGRRRTDKRVLAIGLAAVLALGVIAQIVNANVLSNQGEPTKYGQLNVPDSQLLQLPAGSFEGILEDNLEQGLRITPQLHLSMKPRNGGPAPVITRDVGQQFGTSSGNFSPDQTYRRVWQVDVARPGRYRVSVGGLGPDSGYLLDLGHSPPAGSISIWLWTGIAALLVIVLWLLARGVAYLRRSPSAAR